VFILVSGPLKYGDIQKVNNLLGIVFDGFQVSCIDVLEEDVFHAVLLIELANNSGLSHTVRYFVNYFALERSYVLDVVS
jgi:hypothetical protein